MQSIEKEVPGKDFSFRHRVLEEREFMQDDMPVVNNGVKLSCHADYDHLQQYDTSMWHLLYHVIVIHIIQREIHTFKELSAQATVVMS